jgi:hypothetical protein
VLFAVSDAFFNGTDYVASFADSHSNLTAFVADNDYGAEAEFFTAFDYFGNAPDLNDPLLPFGFFFARFVAAAFFLGALFFLFCHSFVLWELVIGERRSASGNCLSKK